MKTLSSVGSVSILTLSSVVSAACAFASHVLLARHLGPDSFGVFSSSLALVILLVPLAGFGISNFWLKVFSEEGREALRWLNSSFRLLVFTLFMSFFFLVAWAFLGGHNEQTQSVILILSVFVFGQVSIEFAVVRYQLEGRFENVSYLQLAPNLIRLVLIFIFMMFARDVFNVLSVSYIYFIVSLGMLLLSIFIVVRGISDGFVPNDDSLVFSRPNSSSVSTLQLINRAWPFGLAGLFYLIYFQSDIVLLKYLNGDASAGIYNTAIVIMTALYLFPTVLYQKFLLPKLHRWSNFNRGRFREVYLAGNKAMFGLALLAVIFLLVFTEYLFLIVFGESYIDAISVLYIFSIAVPFRFVAASVGSVLVTKEFMRLKVKLMGLVALLNIVLNFMLIPSYGLVGAAVATVVSDIILVSLYYFSAEKYVFNDL